MRSREALETLEAMSNHIVPVRVYVAVFLALLVLTGITVEAARHDFGLFNTIVALSIAVTKATLVIAFFMHVKYAEKLTWLVVGSGVVMLAILVAITLSDYSSRGWSLI